jgi:hypothetical protein
VERDNDEIARTATATGEVFVATTKLRGDTIIRLAIGNERTTEADILRAWQVLRSGVGSTEPPRSESAGSAVAGSG